MNNHKPGKVWGKIAFILLNSKNVTVEFGEWINNFIPHFIMHVITYALKLIHARKRGPRREHTVNSAVLYFFSTTCSIRTRYFAGAIQVISTPTLLIPTTSWHQICGWNLSFRISLNVRHHYTRWHISRCRLALKHQSLDLMLSL